MANDTQATPQWLFDAQDATYHFTLDAAADGSNAKCSRWYGPGGEREDALSAPWPAGDRIWLNPPYSRGRQRAFVEAAIQCAWAGGFVLALLPADTSTRLFHDLIWQRYPVEFLPRRLKFNGATQGAKFGSMLVRFAL